jgi:hypothetical protein
VVLARCAPIDYPAHLERFWRLADPAQLSNPGELVGELLRAVPIDILVRELWRLSNETCEFLVRGLFGPPRFHATLEVVRSGFVAADRNGVEYPVTIPPDERQRMILLLEPYRVRRPKLQDWESAMRESATAAGPVSSWAALIGGKPIRPELILVA